MGGSGYTAIPRNDPLEGTFSDSEKGSKCGKGSGILAVISVIAVIAAITVVVILVVLPMTKHKDKKKDIVLVNYETLYVEKHGPKCRIAKVKAKEGKFYQNYSQGGRIFYSMDNKLWNHEFLLDRQIIHIANASEEGTLNVTRDFDLKNKSVGCPDIKPFVPDHVVPTKIGLCDYYEVEENLTEYATAISYFWISDRRPVVTGQKVFVQGQLYDSAEIIFIQFEEKELPDSDFEPPNNVFTVDLSGSSTAPNANKYKPKPINVFTDRLPRKVIRDLSVMNGERYPLMDPLDPFNNEWTHEVVNGHLVQVRDTKPSHSFTKKNVREALDEIGEENIPEEYDVRKEYGSKCPSTTTILNQLTCGCCWAMAAATTFSDRACIASNGTITKVFSPQHLINCQNSSFGCNGGNPALAWRDMMTDGIIPLDCRQFISQDDVCKTNFCDDGKTKPEFQYAKSAYDIFKENDWDGNMKLIQAEIMKNGPVEVIYYVFPDFIEYQGGVYHHQGSFELQGSHAVRVLGWGNSTTEGPYWLIANSWGPGWGEEGTFRIARGNNECGIEDFVVAGEIKV